MQWEETAPGPAVILLLASKLKSKLLSLASNPRKMWTN